MSLRYSTGQTSPSHMPSSQQLRPSFMETMPVGGRLLQPFDRSSPNIPAETSMSSRERSRKMSTLQQQFDNLKKKIRDVENKNEKIIEKIHCSQSRQILAKRQTTNEQIPSVDSLPVSCEISPLSMTVGVKKPRSSSRECPEKKLTQRKQKPKSAYTNDTATPAQGTQLKQAYEHLHAKNAQLLSMLQTQKQAKDKYTVKLSLLEEKLKQEAAQVTTKPNHEQFKLSLINLSDRFLNIVSFRMASIEKQQKKIKERVENTFRLVENCKKKQRNRKNHSLSVPVIDRHRFQQMSNKYDMLIKVKNDEYECLQNRQKAKERECLELKAQIDKLKEQKKRQQTEFDGRIAEKNQQVQEMAQRLLTLRLEMERKETSVMVTPASQQSFSYINQEIKRLETELSNRDRTIFQKQKQIQELRMKTDRLSSQFQSGIERTRQMYRQRQEQQAADMKQLRESIMEKELQLQQSRLKQSQTEQKLVELEVECNSLQQKLDMKREFDRFRDEQYASLIQRFDMPSDVLKENQNLKRQINKLKQQLQQKCNQIEEKQSKILQLGKNLDKKQSQIVQFEKKQKSNSDWSFIKQNQRQEAISFSCQSILSKERISLQNNILAELQENSEVSRLQSLISDMNTQLTIKNNEMDIMKKQHEETVKQLEDELQVMVVQLNIQREIREQEAARLTKLKEDALQLQKQKNANQIQICQSRLKDCQQALRHKQLQSQRSNVQSQLLIRNLHNQLQIYKQKLLLSEEHLKQCQRQPSNNLEKSLLEMLDKETKLKSKLQNAENYILKLMTEIDDCMTLQEKRQKIYAQQLQKSDKTIKEYQSICDSLKKYVQFDKPIDVLWLSAISNCRVTELVQVTSGIIQRLTTILEDKNNEINLLQERRNLLMRRESGNSSIYQMKSSANESIKKDDISNEHVNLLKAQVNCLGKELERLQQSQNHNNINFYKQQYFRMSANLTQTENELEKLKQIVNQDQTLLTLHNARHMITNISILQRNPQMPGLSAEIKKLQQILTLNKRVQRRE